MAWNYERNESSGYMSLPVGDYRVRIKEAEKTVSSSGNEMLKLTLEVSGTNNLLFHYIVFMPDKPEITNRMLTAFFDSFAGIPDGEFDTAKWKGKIGAVHVKHEDYNGEPQAKVHYFINASKQGNLPKWVEPKKKDDNGGGNVKTASNDTSFVAIEEDVDGDDLPF